ncbi:MAG: DUF2203 domain-containing protein [Phycisphaerae bacterium]
MTLANIIPDIRCSRSLGKSYSQARANRALVVVKRIVGEIVDAHVLLRQLVETAELAELAGDDSRLNICRARQAQLVEKVSQCREELDILGVELTDPVRGIVDFPAVVGGRCGMFCWRLGDDVVGFWHANDESCAHRRPLPMTLRLPTLPRMRWSVR